MAEVSSKFGDVGYDAFRVLVHMACHSLDTENGEQKARRYFGGQEALARSMRPDLPPEEDPSDEAKKAWKNALRDLRRAMEVLVVTGAVTRTVKRPKPGERQEWDLTLRRKAAPVTPSMERRKARDAERRRKKKEGVSPPAVEGTTPPAYGGGDTPPAGGDDTPSPGTTEEPLEDKRKEPCGSAPLEPDRSARAREGESESHLVEVPDPGTAAAAHDQLSRRHDFGVPYVIQAERDLGAGYPRSVYEVRAVELIAATGRRTG